ncbi:MAG: thioredoxin family protein [Mariniblastus sp.]
MAQHLSFKLFQVTSLVGAILLLSFGCNKPSVRDLAFARPKVKSDEAKDDSDARADSAIRQASFDGRKSDGEIALAGGLNASSMVWHESYDDAVAASLASGKPILADFTGSNWCSYCVKLKKEVFETEEFKQWAPENVVLLELDYPRPSRQSAAIKKQNQRLKNKYQITGYPTVLFLNPDGDVLGKLGYQNNPTPWIKAANTILKR